MADRLPTRPAADSPPRPVPPPAGMAGEVAQARVAAGARGRRHQERFSSRLAAALARTTDNERLNIAEARAVHDRLGRP